MEQKRNFTNFLGIGMLVVLVFTIGLFVGRNVTTDIQLFNFGSSSDVDMTGFWRVLDITKSEYVESEDIDDDELVYGAIKGMLASLDDPATIFLTPQETEDFNSVSEGKYFEGIGAELGYENGQIIIVSPLEGSPAKEVGILPGDYILKVDDYEITPQDTVYDVVAIIRGEAGTDVVLTILHRGDTEPKEVTITRREITVPSITLEYIGNQDEIAHLKVSRFTDSSYGSWLLSWDSKVADIKKKGVSKMILDLRGNPGGFFDAAIYTADEFLDEGFVISKQRDGSGSTKDYTSTKVGELHDIEVVVLVNMGSASASEILAGALQDAERATIIGEKTFGKGTAQKIYDFPDGSSLHLTILNWLLPNGVKIDRENSVTPDIEIGLTNDDFVQGVDPQLDEALEVLSK